MQKIFIKSVVLAIALLCNSCTIIPIPIPIPIAIDNGSAEVSPSPSPEQSTTKLEEKYKKTCYADVLTESEGRAITEDSGKLEVAADKLALAGEHKEAIRKYNEAGAATLNEAIKDGSALQMEIDTLLYNKEEVEAFREKHRPLVQRSVESSFKIGSSYSRIGEYEKAIDCFNGVLKVGILPPNDAITYLNRGDTYARMGVKDKAKTDLQQAVVLFGKYKLPSYQKEAEKRLQDVSK